MSQLFRWRKELCHVPGPSIPQLVPVEVEPPPTSQLKPVSILRRRRKPSMVTIELGGGRRLRVESDVDSEALGRILDVLERR